jgi:hypothetical protein
MGGGGCPQQQGGGGQQGAMPKWTGQGTQQVVAMAVVGENSGGVPANLAAPTPRATFGSTPGATATVAAPTAGAAPAPVDSKAPDQWTP